jgi:Na+-driven multidrug efflux pump
MRRTVVGVSDQKVPMEGDNFDLIYGERAWWRPATIAAGFDRLLDVAEWDFEMKRLVALSIPFSLTAVANGAFETVRVALVANFIGTEAVGAYTIVLLLMGLTEEFFGGFTLTSASLCSQAVGAKNYFQAGEYVQIGCVLFSLCMVPNFLVWFFLTDDVVKLFGFNDATAQMAQVYARFHILTLWVKGLDEGYGSLVCVIEHERYYTSMSITSEIVTTCIVLGVLLTKPATLADVGSIELGMKVLFFGLNIFITLCKGWMKDFKRGLFRPTPSKTGSLSEQSSTPLFRSLLGNFSSMESGKY